MLMPKLKVAHTIIISAVLVLTSACAQVPTPISQVTSPPSGVTVENITESDTITSEITQMKSFNQCDSASPFKVQVQFSNTSSQTSQQELVLKVGAGGQAGVSELVKVKLEGAIEQHFASSSSGSQGHQEAVSIEVPPRSQQEYTIIWRETRREGTVEYTENGESKTTNYSYRIGLELISATGRDLVCPTQSLAKSIDIPLPTDSPLPPAVPASTSENTPKDSVLEVGGWWKENGAWMKLENVEFRDPGFIAINLRFWNNTNQSLVFRWDPPVNFSLTDNTGHSYKIYYQYDIGGSEVIESADNIILMAEQHGDTVEYMDEHYLNPSVTDLYFTVNDLSRIRFAQWHIPVPK